MTKPTMWTGRIEHDDGHIYMSITGEHHTKRIESREMEVYREYDDGHCESRNLYTNMYQGRVIAFPGHVNSRYYGSYCQEVEEWEECNHLDWWLHSPITEDERALIESVYPVFGKYVINKSPEKDIQTIVMLLAVWIEHPEVEHIIAAGYIHVALSKTFWKLTDRKRAEVCLFMRQHPGCNMVLRDIQACISNGITIEECSKYRLSEFGKYTYKTYKYLMKQAENDSAWHVRNMYEDYIVMLKKSVHNIKEEYWRYPSDLKAFHDKLLEEYRLEELMRKRALDEQRKKERSQVYKDLRKRVALWPELVIDGYTIHASADAEEWLTQAHTLHQCIVSCEYDTKMSKGLGDIIFIQKDGAPVATAQVFHMQNIGQFYADEHSGTPNGSQPSDDVKAAFEQYMAQAKAMRRAKRRKAA